MHATHNWEEFFGDLGFTISGITTTKDQKLSNHSWRFIRREDIGDYQTGPEEDWKITCPCSEWEKWAPEPSDAILLVKESIASKNLTQPPLLVFPAKLAKDLKDKQLNPLKRNALTPTECKEFAKTARYLSNGDPWTYTRASDYLLNLVKSNKDQVWPAPPAIKLVLDRALPVVCNLPNPPDWEKFAPEAPRTIMVHPVGAAAGGRGRGSGTGRGKGRGRGRGRGQQPAGEEDEEAEKEEQHQPAAPVGKAKKAKGKAKGKANAKSKAKGCPNQKTDSPTILLPSCSELSMAPPLHSGHPCEAFKLCYGEALSSRLGPYWA